MWCIFFGFFVKIKDFNKQFQSQLTKILRLILRLNVKTIFLQKSLFAFLQKPLHLQ